MAEFTSMVHDVYDFSDLPGDPQAWGYVVTYCHAHDGDASLKHFRKLTKGTMLDNLPDSLVEKVLREHNEAIRSDGADEVMAEQWNFDMEALGIVIDDSERRIVSG